jgi:uncharacterized GH25 family protein
MRTIALCACALVAASVLARAHDFWIEPSTFTAQPNGLLGAALRVGDFGRGDRVPRADERIAQFVCAGPSEVRAIVGLDGADPAGHVRLQSAGVYVLGYRSKHAAVEIAPETFASYLRERGLEAVLDERARRGESELPGREIYSRCAKALVTVGEGSGSGFDKRLSFMLELVPEKNPASLARSDDGGAFEPLPVRLEFEGRALAHALVGATSLDEPPRDALDPTNVIHARTDADGRVELWLPRHGRWLVAAVHMVPATDRATADWESFWASLTFELP